MTLFKNKYRVEPSRLQTWNYSWQGQYYVTVCTNEMKPLFGVIKNREMVLNRNGEIVGEWMLKMDERYDNAMLNACVVMPNHFHCIILIGDDKQIGSNTETHVNQRTITRGNPHPVTRGNPHPVTRGNPHPVTRGNPIVETIHPSSAVALLRREDESSLQLGGTDGWDGRDGRTHGHNITPLCHQRRKMLLSKILGYVKMNASKHINIHENKTGRKIWQTGYWDRIIRNQIEYERIVKYIMANPWNWKGDRFHQ